MNTDESIQSKIAAWLNKTQRKNTARTDDSRTSLTDTNEENYLDRLSFTPEQVQHFELVKDTLGLTRKELALLRKNGFAVSDRLTFEDFTTAYGYIYWKDLPVLITSDSILHSIHQAHEEMLTHVEGTVIFTYLAYFLKTARAQLQTEMQAIDDPGLVKLYRDLDIYLAVPLELLTREVDTAERRGRGYASASAPSQDTSPAQSTPEAYIALATEAGQIAPVGLFGGRRRQIDFTLFTPRGHYANGGHHLRNYFRAMSWLAHIDFRFIDYLPTNGQPVLQPGHIAAAALLREIIDKADLRSLWDELDALLSTFVGHSDNMRLDGLDTFLADAGIQSAAEALDYARPDRLLQLLTINAYGDQQISGQILARHTDNRQAEAMPRPVSFVLNGQRFTLDSYLMSNLVYDQLMVNGQPVKRALPSPLDVMYLLGNDRAVTHLQTELKKYGYAENLAELREDVRSFELGFWSDTIYNRWLNILRTLNTTTTESSYPQAMRTTAWADKMLHTQLASWAQLRHNSVLYVKQSRTPMSFICQYPDGYVEPYPEFYAAVAEYADFGRTLFETSPLLQLAAGEDSPEYLQATHTRIIDYFDTLADVAGRLQRMAEKELRLEPFSAEEYLFLKSVVIRQDYLPRAYGGPDYDKRWNGWFPKLFVYRDKGPEKIADIHTNDTDDPRSALYPPRVLHVGTGPVAVNLFIADTDEGPTIYVGPSLTYFEQVEAGRYPTRLTDMAWKQRLLSRSYPQPPEWTGSFRLPVSEKPKPLKVPHTIE